MWLMAVALVALGPGCLSGELATAAAPPRNARAGSQEDALCLIFLSKSP